MRIERKNVQLKVNKNGACAQSKPAHLCRSALRGANHQTLKPQRDDVKAAEVLTFLLLV